MLKKKSVVKKEEGVKDNYEKTNNDINLITIYLHYQPEGCVQK